MNYLLISCCLHCKPSPHALPVKMEKKLKTVFYLDIKAIILFRHRGSRYLVIQHSPGTTRINHWSVTYRTSISPGNPRIMSINSIWHSLLLSSWKIIIFQFGSWKGSCCFWLLSLTLCFCVNFLSSCIYLGLQRSNPRKNWVGVCGPLPKTLTLFKTKICDFPYPISDLTKNLIPSFTPIFKSILAVTRLA